MSEFNIPLRASLLFSNFSVNSGHRNDYNYLELYVQRSWKSMEAYIKKILMYARQKSFSCEY